MQETPSFSQIRKYSLLNAKGTLKMTDMALHVQGQCPLYVQVQDLHLHHGLGRHHQYREGHTTILLQEGRKGQFSCICGVIEVHCPSVGAGKRL
uniref:Uncharacterized protein n=1 Tax=Lepeophtheirus salmonis TaxID=72036 RepID=A0A0K2U8V1_LEPSM